LNDVGGNGTEVSSEGTSAKSGLFRVSYLQG
jgi:hypothetical protein